jgi:hypothetical protein
VTAALARLAVREQPKGSNRSPEIDAWLTAVGSDVGQAWCAAFVHAMGREVVGDQWAFRRSARVQDVVDAAVKRLRTASILHAEKGDLAVFFFPTLKRYAHIGIIVETPKDGVLVTVDGNTIADTAGDSREGWGVFVKRRKVNVDRMLALTWPEGA